MNDDKVQLLSDETLEQVSGGGIGEPPTSREEAEIAQLEAKIAQLEAQPSPGRVVEFHDKKFRVQELKGYLDCYLDWMK